MEPLSKISCMVLVDKPHADGEPMKPFIPLLVPVLFLNAVVAMAIEEPKFTVEAKNEIYELRRYKPVLVAETLVQDEFDKAGNKAFRILADYIFGKNKAKTKIEMTSPVNQLPVSEKIAMTAPVIQSKSGKGFLVQFTMPETFNLQNIPEPEDSRVVVRQMPARRVAVLTYSGSWSESRYRQKLAELLSALQKDGIDTVGEPIFARFDSPFRLWFLRRNEIWLELPQ